MTSAHDAGRLLETKLHVPPQRRAQIARPRLRERLSRGLEARLTLVSAPAGFGKSTLLADWIASLADDGPRAAWLSLDPSDSQPGTFWSYVVAALRTVAPDVGVTSASLLREPQPPPIRSVLETLLNELGATTPDVVLVLDDYHLIESLDIDEEMVFFLEHLPRQAHLLMATRADPAFPLARLRARGELVEVRATDLRFTTDEADIYLNEVMGLGLTTADVLTLEGRTEGWIAALQLAALSVQGRTDAADFIAGFAGDDRYIVDYLVEEVLQRQREPVRRFLLRTSILDRLSGPSCDAITGESGGKVMLERLERGNLFVVPLDDRRHWYRYHHLFAAVLAARLRDEQPDIVATLHRRASVWYADHGESSEAIRHALAAGDVERAAGLIEGAMPALRRSRQGTAEILRWLEGLDDEVVDARPVLAVHHAGLLLDSGQLDGAEARLRSAERWIGTDGVGRPIARSEAPIVVDVAEFQRLPASIAVYRAAQAHLTGDVDSTIAHAGRALELIGPDDHLGRGSAAGLLALAAWTTGDLDAAHRAWADAMTDLEAAGHIADAVECAVALGDIRSEQGRPTDAILDYERGMRLATERRSSVVRGAADMHVGISERSLERGDLDAAHQHLAVSKEMGEHLGSRQNPYRWRVAMARVRAAEDDPVAALALLDEADRLYVSDFYPEIRPIHALRARLWVDQGRLADARAWARVEGLSADDQPDYLRTFEQITLARLLLAEARRDRGGHALDAAFALLDRLLEAVMAGGRMAAAIEILVLQALAHGMRRPLEAALVPLRRALELAEPERYVRVFIDAGAPMAELLGMLEARQGSPEASALLTSIARGRSRARHDPDLQEPLSARELEVLRLLATDLDGPGIARELVVSLSTIRSHTKSIYGKLGVSSRRAAVRRGDELDLSSRPDRSPARADKDV